MKEEKRGSKCKFWVPKKRRFCSNIPLPNSSFCGNHTTRPDGHWVLCPIDPSHSVLEENLQSHRKRCPLLKQAHSLSLQPFYQKGINSGHNSSSDNITSLMKRKAVYTMNLIDFSKLISKIQSIHASICNDIRHSHKITNACHIWINRQVDRKLPFQEKHVLQQASILGNLEEIGVLNGSSDVRAVVEFGAGRGYLTQMLADCYGIKKVFLVERKSYKLKADRSLRQIETLKLERLRIDIEDLNLNAVESLQGVPYVAIGKHLCGTATDMTLRCCLTDQNSNCGELRGLAIATCCHHLCQWKHYINQRYMSELGISKEDFNAISWFSSWAVDDHHSCSVEDSNQHIRIIMDSDSDNASSSSSSSCGVEAIVRKMSAGERAVLGLMCKDIIDVGRLMWIKQQHEHDESQLLKYVPSNISPENHLLITTTSTPPPS